MQALELHHLTPVIQLSSLLASDIQEPHAFHLLVLLGLVVLNGFFVASEFALVLVRESQLDELADDGSKLAKFARRMTGKLEMYLSATQLGITMSSLALGWLGEPYLAAMLHPLLQGMGITSPVLLHGISLTTAFASIIFLHVVLGELVPKSLATRKPVATTLLLCKPLALFHFLTRPFVWLMQRSSELLQKYVFRMNPADDSEIAHSEEELRQIVAETGATEEVSPIGREILINALDMGRRVARDIMTPRGQVISLDVEKPFDACLEEAVNSRHTRFPACRKHLDSALGLIHIKDLLASVQSGNRDLTRITRELIPVSEMMPLEKLLKLFLNRHAHLALVVDEYGGTVGIVTLDNVLEELVGEIHDEFDMDKPEYIALNDDEFVVAGTLGLHELEEFADLSVANPEVSTVGGYVVHILGHLPEVGESISIGNYRATVTHTDGKSIGKLHFKRLPPSDEELDEEGATAKNSVGNRPTGS